MRQILFTILLAVSIHSTPGWSGSLVIGEEDGEYVIKHIISRVGERLRALVEDDEGHITQLIISSEDAREAKRGRWVLRPGIYPSDL